MSSEHLTEPVVVDALPNSTSQTSQSAPGQQHVDPRALAGSAAEQISSLGQLLNPLASTFSARLGKGIGQVRQWSQEKLGTAEDVTELPQEYKVLEKRVDALRNVHQTLLRITRVYSTSSYDYPINYQETVLDLGKTAANTFQGLQSLAISPAERAEAEAAAAAKPVEQQVPPRTLPHAIARAALAGSEQLGLEDPLGQALFKYATIQEKVGDSRVKSDTEVNTKFVQPFQTTLKTNIEFAMRARRNVQSVRLALDSCKARYRIARPEKSEAARLEVEQAEDQFVAAVEEATTLMKSVLETPEPLRNLADLIAAQLTFYQEAAAMLADLAPEIDEMQVTQEALYRNLRGE